MRLNTAAGKSLFVGLICLALTTATGLAATSKTAKRPTAATPTGKSVISRDPYVGAIVLDAATGKELFADQADAKGYPASMLKLMDLLIILEKVEQGQLSFQDQVPVSAKASHIGGSRVWLKEKESFTIDEMLYALMIQSANDVATALAEKVGGTAEGFVELMNKKAAALGMTSTVFHSVHGLPPGKGQEHDVTTARDFSKLCLELLKHQDALRYTGAKQRSFRTNDPTHKIDMVNHNKLLWRLDGCDGLKTGYIAQSGWSMAVTAARRGQRVIVVVLDSNAIKTRDAKATELAAKGFEALGPVAPAPAPAAAAAPAPATPAAGKKPRPTSG
jgi:D-alanyl-D-alanine carboxypeptidase (penicillin-binding protein 5/6)